MKVNDALHGGTRLLNVALTESHAINMDPSELLQRLPAGQPWQYVPYPSSDVEHMSPSAQGMVDVHNEQDTREMAKGEQI
jgi:hypothetical protein